MVHRVVEHFGEAETPDALHVVGEGAKHRRDLRSPDHVLGRDRGTAQLEGLGPLGHWRQFVPLALGRARLRERTFTDEPAQVGIDSLPRDAEVLSR